MEGEVSAMTTIFGELTTAMGMVLGWLGDAVTALVSADGELHALWPLAMVGLGFAIVRIGFGYIKSFTWGF